MALECRTVRGQQLLPNRNPAVQPLPPPTRVELLVEGGDLGGEEARHEAILGEHLQGVERGGWL